MSNSDNHEPVSLSDHLIQKIEGHGVLVFDGGLANQCANALAEHLANDNVNIGMESLSVESQVLELQSAIGAWQAMAHVYGEDQADDGMALFYATHGSNAGASDYIRFNDALRSMAPDRVKSSALYVEGKSQEANPWAQMLIDSANQYGVQVYHDTEAYLNHVRYMREQA